MPTEQGIVIKTRDNLAWVRTMKSSTCEGCTSRDACGSVDGGREMEVEAFNPAGANAGDLVMISFGTAPLIKVYSLVYIFPILALLGGAILGQRLSLHFPVDESLLSLVFGFLFFIGAFFVIKFHSGRMARKETYRPKILRIISTANMETVTEPTDASANNLL